MTIRQCFFCRGLLAVILSAFLAPCHAHSGKARFHAVVDTDGAADDLRTLCMLLGNREVEVLAVTTSEGALLPDSAAVRVRALLDSFYHEGVPVGAGRAVNAPAPAWRAHSGTVDWGDAATATSGAGFPAASALIAETLGEEEEKVVFIALGALTNLYDVLRENPASGDRIDRIVWYNSRAEPLSGANFETDSVAARYVLASGVPVTVVSANPACPVVVTPALIDSVAAVPNVYARKIAATHRTPPLAKLVGERHLEAWDDLVAVYLFAPELFSIRELNGTVRACELSDKSAAAEAQTRLTAILRGKPDSESRVFYGFPVGGALYAADVVPIIDSAVARHGLSEWRAGVLTNELHGHLGIYATIGVKMGIRARSNFTGTSRPIRSSSRNAIPTGVWALSADWFIMDVRIGRAVLSTVPFTAGRPTPEKPVIYAYENFALCCRQGQSVRRCPYHRIRPSSGSVYPICPMFAAANDER